MSSPTDKLRIGTKNDKRKRVTPELEATFEKMYHQEGTSLRKIERDTGITRRTIKSYLFPEYKEEWAKQRYAEKPWLKYYDKDKHREYMRAHRKRLKELGIEK